MAVNKERKTTTSLLFRVILPRLNGTYENLDGGDTADALEDLTGGVTESIDLVTEKYEKDEEEKKNLHKDLKKCAERQFLISASITGVGHPIHCLFTQYGKIPMDGCCIIQSYSTHPL